MDFEVNVEQAQEVPLGSEDLGSAAILLCDLRKILSFSVPPEHGQQPQAESSLQMIFCCR